METKSDRILTSVKLWFLLPLLCKINVFTGQKPFQNETKSLQKKTLQLDPPKIASFPYRATLDGIMNRKGFQKGPQNRAPRAANLLWKSMIFGGPPPIPPPQEPQAARIQWKSMILKGPPSLSKSPKPSISEALLINFEQFLIVSNQFLSTCFSLVCTCSRNDSQWFNNCVKDIDTLKKSTMGNHFETEETQGKLES